jgi:5'-nucleotidase
MTARPLVLLSNDDGHAAPGLRALRAALLPFADVVVCAPESNQSATSHSLSLHRVLRLRSVEEGIFAVDGTPADCVYVALHSDDRVVPRRPDLVVSGMNHGLNLGADIFYSGTVAAAREGAMRQLPAIAVSADGKADRKAAAALGARLAMALLETGAARTLGKPLLNVNIPPGDRWEVRATCIGTRLYDNAVVFRTDPRGQEYLWIGGASVRHEQAPGSDTEAYDEGCVSVTPLAMDLYDAATSEAAAAVAASVRGADDSHSTMAG